MLLRPLVVVFVLFAAASCASAGVATIAEATPTPTPISSPTPSPTPSPSPSPSLAAESAAAYFRPIGGYEWVTPPQTVRDAVVTAFSDPSLAQYIASPPEARLVTQRGEATSMLLLVLPLDPSYAALPGAVDSIIKGYGGAPPQTLTVSGRRALLLVEDPQHTFKSLVWQHRAFVLWLYGFNGISSDTMTSFAQTVVTANQ